MNVDVWRARPAGGEPERLTTQHAAVNYPALIDARTLLYVAREEDGSGPWLWALDVERKTTTRVSSGVDQYTSVAASRDGRRHGGDCCQPQLQPVARAAHGSASRTIATAQPYPLPVPTGQAFAPRFGGGSLFYLSARGTGDGLWKVDDSGHGSQVWRNVDAALSEPPAVSPDGHRLALVVRQNGKRTLWIMSADGSNRADAGGVDRHTGRRGSRAPWTGRLMARGSSPAAATRRVRRSSRSRSMAACRSGWSRARRSIRCGRRTAA